MDEETKRQEIVSLYYLEKLTVVKISKILERSRTWVYNWLERYESDRDGLWYKEKSRRPKSIPNKLSAQDEDTICNVRRELEITPFAQIGAINIQYTLHSQGISPPPLWTINRVIQRNDLVKKSKQYQAKGHPYPKLFINTQQMDLVGPRYLGTKRRFYSVNLINTETHIAGCYPTVSKSSIDIANAMISHWKIWGFPDALQIDNEMCFRGSNRHPRSLGIVLRLALSQGIVTVFIPNREPWRNGVIERFNQTYERHVLKSVYCQTREDLTSASNSFSHFHNENHRYSSQANKTPKQMVENVGLPLYLDKEYQLPRKILLEEGLIIFVRFIRSDCSISILGTVFKVSRCLQYSYVLAELIIQNHVLVIRQDNIIYHVFDFVMHVDW